MRMLHGLVGWIAGCLIAVGIVLAFHIVDPGIGVLLGVFCGGMGWVLGSMW